MKGKGLLAIGGLATLGLLLWRKRAPIATAEVEVTNLWYGSPAPYPAGSGQAVRFTVTNPTAEAKRYRVEYIMGGRGWGVLYPELEPGQSEEILLPVVIPDEPGTYESKVCVEDATDFPYTDLGCVGFEDVIVE